MINAYISKLEVPSRAAALANDSDSDRIASNTDLAGQLPHDKLEKVEAGVDVADLLEAVQVALDGTGVAFVGVGLSLGYYLSFLLLVI